MTWSAARVRPADFGSFWLALPACDIYVSLARIRKEHCGSLAVNFSQGRRCCVRERDKSNDEPWTMDPSKSAVRSVLTCRSMHACKPDLHGLLQALPSSTIYLNQFVLTRSLTPAVLPAG